MSTAAQGFSETERQAAWAAYYAQQGYTQDQIASMMASWGPGESANAEASSSAPTYDANQYDKDGYKIGSVGSGATAPKNVPVLGAEPLKPKEKQKAPSHGKAPKQKQSVNKQRDTVIRTAGGRTWEDPTLVDWDPEWYRLFVGDVSNDVSERTLDEAFAKYRSYCKCKVVRDRLSQKAKYGFIAFKDPEDFLKAWKEMDGKYVGNRPIRLSKIKEDKYGTIETTALSNRKAKQMDKLRRNGGQDKARPSLW
ncbi:hypothetical protein CspHIS471_0211470 [Cutaneotrichosporon sp. HIS471]|nr:hypothetical protein CspHIS471_0211470 [Cutaneotrichosporon sp. HIS471]